MNQNDKAIKKADAALHDEYRRQVNIIYGSAAVALKSKWKFGQTKIVNIFEDTYRLWDNIGEHNELSILQLLEDETGIEVRLTNSSASWHDLSYLNNKLPKLERVTKAQYIFMRNRQRQWIGAMIQACLYLTLYRDYDFGVLKLRHLMEEIEQIRAKHNQKESKILKTCREVTGINFKSDFVGMLESVVE